MLPHNLLSEIGSSIICLSNLNPPRCTCLVSKNITGNILEAIILTGKSKGEVVRSTMPFRGLHFSIRLAFAMFINKSKSQVQQCQKIHVFPLGNYVCK